MKRRQGFFHEPQSGEGKTSVWLTPPEFIKDLGPFDLDPCAAPEPRPWPTAKVHYTKEDDGLTQRWFGFVWMNPPYGRKLMPPWMKKLADHGEGIAMTFARTDTNMFFKSVWPLHSGILFIKGRVNFRHQDGTMADNAGAPSILIGYGDTALRRLTNTKIEGHLVVNAGAIILDASGRPIDTWKEVIRSMMAGKKMQLRDIYKVVGDTDKARYAKARGWNWMATVRRTLQENCTPVDHGVWAGAPA